MIDYRFPYIASDDKYFQVLNADGSDWDVEATKQAFLDYAATLAMEQPDESLDEFTGGEELDQFVAPEPDETEEAQLFTPHGE